MAQEIQKFCYYLGKPYPLNVTIDELVSRTTIKWDGKSFICISPSLNEIEFNDALKAFFIKDAKNIIEKRLKLYQVHFKVKYRKITIDDSHNKWGSCNSDHNLTFNWKLLLFPIEVIDYVVVHELCHLVHMNHDRSFWRLVGKIFPDYKNSMTILGTEKTKDL